ncbi:hypothetical protein [Halodesulfovibrio spirochaetisodalis]|uniref:Tail tubular protein A n=1 Tax=Halodesulfovibrio spirochaetisodalis TaxID=1560234 RepID=A0A1B7XA12_9BACT|nr:hypothetical protein [Halodesulfovibrio spirochaetisodalis]OBQ46211.1 hypothetical protein SP90_13500 [Halodesulfovibrio spirochaetisodalis]
MSKTLTIINRALGEVNAPAISELSDGTVYAEVASRSWQPARDAVLRAHPWPCCLRRAKLNRSPDKPAWEYAYAHVLPVDYAVLVSVYPETSYAIESGVILSDQKDVSIKYVSTDTKLYDAALEDAIVYELASRLAMPLTSKKSLSEKLEQKALVCLRRAIHTTTRETTPKDIRTNKWKSAKLGYRRSR